METKIKRAKLHASTLDEEFRERLEQKLYRFSVEIHANGREHVYRAVHPPRIPPDWSALVGDCVHSLRCALDHLAWQLVHLNGQQPTFATQFPIRQSILKRDPCTGVVRPTPLVVSGGVNTAAMALIDAVQPYKRGEDSATHPLFLLHGLDVIDKHRHLVLTVVGVRHSAYSTVSYMEDGEWISTSGAAPAKVHVTGKPLKHGGVVAKVTWPYPKRQVDPNFQMTPNIMFGKGCPRAVVGDFVAGVLNRLIRFVEDETVARFIPLFP